MIGAGSQDIKFEATLDIKGEKIPPRNLRTTTSAINYDDKSSVRMSYDPDRYGYYMESTGGWLKFAGTVCDSFAEFHCLVATASNRGSISVYAVNANGRRFDLGTSPVPPTGGKRSFVNLSFELKKVRGIRDIYINLSDGLSLHSFKFI